MNASDRRKMKTGRIRRKDEGALLLYMFSGFLIFCMKCCSFQRKNSSIKIKEQWEAGP